jgi:hypothetical protein
LPGSTIRPHKNRPKASAKPEAAGLAGRRSKSLEWGGAGPRR